MGRGGAGRGSAACGVLLVPFGADEGLVPTISAPVGPAVQVAGGHGLQRSLAAS